jgi:hypothetical protein
MSGGGGGGGGEEDPDRYPPGSRASVWSVTINTNQFAYPNNLDVYRERLLTTFRNVFRDKGIYNTDADSNFIAIFTRADYERRPRMHVHGTVTVVHFGRLSMDYEKARAEIINSIGIGNLYVFFQLINSPLQMALYARKTSALQEEQRRLLTTRVTRSRGPAVRLFDQG